jgi:hypothetical protein
MINRPDHSITAYQEPESYIFMKVYANAATIENAMKSFEVIELCPFNKDPDLKLLP